MTELTEEKVEKITRQLKLIVFLVVVVPIVALVIFMEFRSGSVEDDLRYREPNVRDEARMDIDTLPWHPVVGQTLYVPAYTHIYYQDKQPRLLTVTLSIRNTDRENEIAVSLVKYFDTSGKEKRSMLAKPLKLAPLASTEFVIDQNDRSNGGGASFIVHWQSGHPVTHPVVETLMVDTSNTQGISFVRSATVLDENLQP